ncbi:hypothetical protein [Burkholderia multivorans]|uniref:hypothetical protein n=1 Tax=Burkholderia multivorans TaxID=87883 RepID=UPI000CFE71FC|nr:hypothetical protein [Burkholderia multivorans]PRF55324.1 hypothetical protein C6Q11_05235 [Burkholderia multivorans]
MADLSDVGNVLAGLIGGFLYPNGTAAPSAAGMPVRVYPGWPDPASLDADMAAGTAHVSIYPHPTGRNTTRYSSDWKTTAAPTQTLGATVSGNEITISGTVATPQTVAILANGAPFVYAVQASDTLSSIAAALATLIAAQIPGTTSAGAVITLPTSARIAAARISASGTIARVVRSQEHSVQVTVWAPSPAARVQVATAFDALLSDLRFLSMPDGFGARLVYSNSYDTDRLAKATAYRRDFLYSVDFATTIAQQAAQIAIEQLNVAPQIAGVDGSAPVFTTYE